MFVALTLIEFENNQAKNKVLCRSIHVPEAINTIVIPLLFMHLKNDDTISSK